MQKKQAFFLVLWGLICLLLMPFSGLAQQDSANGLYPPKEYIISCFRDGFHFPLAPLHWKGEDFIKAGAVGLSIWAVSTQDVAVKDFAQSHRTKTTDFMADKVAAPFGNGYYSVPILGAFYLYGTLKHDNRSRETALLGAESFAITSAYGHIIKQLTHRHRPYQDNNPGIWDGPFSELRFASFPSGHTFGAFSVATIIALEYRDKPLVPVIAYTIAGMAGLARINSNYHWASDVFAGACLGVASGSYIYNRHHAKDKYLRKNEL